MIEYRTEQVNRSFVYAGFVLLAFELVRGMIVGPIKAFYKNTVFAESMPFTSYEHDVLWRHKKEFEACLFYLRDFMEAIDNDDVVTIMKLRHHRNELAHELPQILAELRIEDHHPLFKDVTHTLFKLSNYRAYMEIGADPEFRGVDWETAKGHEYLMYEEIVRKIAVMSGEDVNCT